MSKPIIYDGREDVRRAAADLAERLPEPLAPLARLAFNYRWSWLAGGKELFAGVDAERFTACGENPLRLLQESSSHVLERAASDSALLERAAALEQAVLSDLDRPAWTDTVDLDHPVAFLCAEYGVHVSLPVYSGGLGALAGDLLKEASDRALPLVAVGLMYHKGYFRQRIDASGWQHEYWIETDPKRLPAALVTGEDGQPVTITVPIYENVAAVRVWRLDIGRVPLFLLDTDFADNDPLDCWITSRLYDADPETRLAQYVLLGIGGIRALRAIGIEPGLVHLNEGHAALAPVELAAPALRAAASGHRSTDVVDAALQGARRRTVFTTHTPVPAGNDSYPTEHALRALRPVGRELGLRDTDLLALGRTHQDDAGEPFGVTQAALRMSCAANGVSRRHGEVAREMWNPLWPKRSVDEVPIRYVTNGVHVPTWIGRPMRELFDRYLGEDWLERAGDPKTWEPVDDIPDGELWEARTRQRADLVQFVRERSPIDRLGRGDVREYVDAAAKAFDPEALTIGFARRVATYKRLELLTRDPEWTLRLLTAEKPVQVVLAGKAHPRDDEAKRTVQHLFGLKAAKVVGDRVCFFDDYDLSSAARLVRGCDVWLNLPRPPLEASGTSGMKSSMNGGLQLSVLDGWWPEAYEPGKNGWALSGDVLADPYVQDERDAGEFHRIIDEEVIPTFYARTRGVPKKWLAMVRASLKSVGPRFSASRMVSDYVVGPYHSATGR